MVLLCWWFNICKLLCKSFHTYWLYWKSNQASNTRERVGKQVEEVNFCFSSYPPAPGKQPSHGATHKLYCSILKFFFIIFIWTCKHGNLQCLHDFQFMKKESFSLNLFKLASCQFMKTWSLELFTQWLDFSFNFCKLSNIFFLKKVKAQLIFSFFFYRHISSI